jgi:hypothetical protein
MGKTLVIDLSKEIADILSAYTDEVTEGLEKSKLKVAKNAVKTLRQTSPEGDTGDYAKGWNYLTTRGDFVIYNATDYQLTHLLEYGHAKVNGGRVAPRVHIRPVEEQVIKEFTKEVEKVIKG